MKIKIETLPPSGAGGFVPVPGLLSRQARLADAGKKPDQYQALWRRYDEGRLVLEDLQFDHCHD